MTAYVKLMVKMSVILTDRHFDYIDLPLFDFALLTAHERSVCSGAMTEKR